MTQKELQEKWNELHIQRKAFDELLTSHEFIYNFINPDYHIEVHTSKFETQVKATVFLFCKDSVLPHALIKSDAPLDIAETYENIVALIDRWNAGNIEWPSKVLSVLWAGA